MPYLTKYNNFNDKRRTTDKPKKSKVLKKPQNEIIKKIKKDK